MQAAAIIVTLLALYVALYSFCKVAAEAEATADRYKRRTSSMRSTIPAVWRISNGFRETSVEVARGR